MESGAPAGQSVLLHHGRFQGEVPRGKLSFPQVSVPPPPCQPSGSGPERLCAHLGDGYNDGLPPAPRPECPLPPSVSISVTACVTRVCGFPDDVPTGAFVGEDTAPGCWSGVSVGCPWSPRPRQPRDISWRAVPEPCHTPPAAPAVSSSRVEAAPVSGRPGAACPCPVCPGGAPTRPSCTDGDTAARILTTACRHGGGVAGPAPLQRTGTPWEALSARLDWLLRAAGWSLSSTTGVCSWGRRHERTLRLSLRGWPANLSSDGKAVLVSVWGGRRFGQEVAQTSKSIWDLRQKASRYENHLRSERIGDMRSSVRFLRLQGWGPRSKPEVLVFAR